MSVSMTARHSRGMLHRRLIAALLCIVLLLTSLSFLSGAELFEEDIHTFARVCTNAKGERFVVQVFSPAETLIPADAVLQVEELTYASAAYDDYLERVEAVFDSENSIENARFFDISLVSRDDPTVQYQPAEGTSVEVSIRLEEAPDVGMSVVHFAEDEEPEVLDSLTDGHTVSFETTGFSIYALVDAPSIDDLNDALIVHSLDELGSEGYFISGTSNNGNTYWMTTGTVNSSNAGYVINRTAANNPAGAERYYFEPVTGTNDQFYLYYIDANNVRQYVKLTKDTKAELVTSQAQATALTIAPCGTQYPDKFYLSFVQSNKTYYLNLRKDDNGKGFSGSTYNTGGSMLTLWHDTKLPDDPFGLSGKSFGIVRYAGSDAITVNALTSYASTSARLAGETVQLHLNPLDFESNLLVTDGDLTMWSFHLCGEQTYHITIDVDGVTKYLRINGNAAQLVDTPDENCEITITSGTGSHLGYYKFTSPGGTLTSAGSSNNPYFYGSGGTSSNCWLKLAEPSNLNLDDLVSYSAEKVSIAGNANEVSNGDQVVIYTRVWNETNKKYDFYIVNHNGKLIPAYDEGDTIRWEGSSINTALWDFTEYYYPGTTTPNYYYELQNVYSHKYLAPQIQDGQILSNHTIGVNLNGRRWNDYYTTIMAWDDPHYDYASFATDGTERIIPVTMSQGMAFYFAKMEPTQQELTTADTVDNNNYGINLKLVKFPADQVYGNTSTNGGRNRLQTDVIGAGTDYVSGDALKFPTLDLVSTDLDANGYPTALLTNRSLEDLFGSATDANHLFLQKVYDESGYFQYDCTQTFATLGDDGDFTVYNQLGTINVNARSQGHGQFMPYNDLNPNLVSDYVNISDVYNNPISLDNPRYGEELLSIPVSEAQYHFGMEMEATFIQPPDGLDDWGHDIIFEFAGDDDMWLYVDGELILDLGGIHSALVGKINFSTGEVLIPSTTESSGNSAISVPTTLRALVKENYWGRNPEMSEADVEAYLDTVFKPGTSVFPDYSSHTMKMFYMERGASMSNLYMRFNLTTATDGQLLLEKTVSGTDKQEYSNARFAYQIWYFDKEYNEWRTVSRTEVPGEGDEVTYEYTGASSVNYVGTTTPVEYQSSYENLYNNVFFLTPGQMADIRFPDDTTEYFVRECYIDTSIYDTVHANNVLLTGTPVDPNDPVFQDFQTQPEVIGKRKVVNYNNHVDEDSLSHLLITKQLFDADGYPLHYEDDPTGFRFRVYMGSEEPLDYYRLDKYHVKDPNGNYCYYDAATASFASTGISDFSQIPESQLASVTFTTSPSGAIDKIPADYTVEIRNLMWDTKFCVEERFSDIPRGYNLINYERAQDDNSYTPAEGDTDNAGTIRNGENPHVVVNNQRGWGLTAVKNWSDKDFMQSHDDIYIAVYNSHIYPQIDSSSEPIEGTIRIYTASTSSLYYYFEDLEDDAEFSDYVIREVVLTDPVVDADGYVIDYTSITPVNPGGILQSGGIPYDSNDHVNYDYSARYTVGQPTGVNLNIRTDTVTNERPGIRIVKTDWLGNPLPDAYFTLEDENGDPVGQPRYKSGADGLVTIAYLEPDAPYTLTEQSPPYQYVALMDSVTMTLSNGTVTVTGAPQDVVTVVPDDPSGMQTVYVKNRRTSMLVRKVDAADHTVGLDDVHFALYPQVMGVHGPRKDYFPIEGMGDLVTDMDGYLTGFPDWLSAGTYYLEETVAPRGYTPLSEDLVFTVEENGEITVHNESMQSWLTPVDDPQTGERTYVFTIENSGTKSIALLKTNMDGTLYLPGAQFSLYHKNDFDDSTNTPLPNAQAITSGETDENGILQLGDLTIGEYRLVETRAPFTYVCLTEPVRLFVYAHNVEVLQDSNYTSAIIQQDGTYLVTVKNHQGYEMPSVGGIGVVWFYCLGCILVLTGTGLLLSVGRRRRRRTKT